MNDGRRSKWILRMGDLQGRTTVTEEEGKVQRETANIDKNTGT